MKNKKLRLKYSFLFFIAFAFSVLFLNIYKNNQIESILALNIKTIKKSYANIYNQNKEISELIFYNNLLFDEKLSKLIQKESKKKTYEYLKEKFFYYKKFGISNINIYFPNNRIFLKMNKNKENYSKSENDKILNYVHMYLKDYEGIRVHEKLASIIFIKPLLDKKLKHIATIELTFSLKHVAKLMRKDLDYSFSFIVNNFNSNNKKNIDILMKNNKNISLINKDLSSTFAFPIFDLLNKEKNIYLFALKKEKLKILSLIDSNFYKNVAICFFIYLVVFTLLFLLKVNTRKKNSLDKKYKDLLAAIDKYVVMVDTNKNGVITNVTERFCTLSGYSKKELKGQNINIINHPNMPKKFFKDMWESITNGKKWEGEVMNLDKLGNSYWVKGSIFPKYNKNRKLIGFTSIRVNTTDTQQLKKINYLLKEDLSNKLNEIRMKDKSLINDTKIELMSKILDSVSYQWKKPISNLSINLVNLNAYLEKSDLNINDIRNIYKEMENELKSLSLKLNDFNAIFTSRTENDKYNVYTAIKESIKLLRHDCKLYNISIKLDSKKEIYCFGVFHELKYIMVNLLNSSVEQIISNNMPSCKIVLSTIEDENGILIKYTDNIKGKSKKIIDEVFSNNYNEAVNKDIGLSLNVAKLLIKKIGAEMWFENEKENTTFYIKLVSKDRRMDKRL